MNLQNTLCLYSSCMPKIRLTGQRACASGFCADTTSSLFVSTGGYFGSALCSRHPGSGLGLRDSGFGF